MVLVFALICIAAFTLVSPVTVELKTFILNVAVGRITRRVRTYYGRWYSRDIRQAYNLCCGFALRGCCYEVAVEGVGSVNEDVT